MNETAILNQQSVVLLTTVLTWFVVLYYLIRLEHKVRLLEKQLKRKETVDES